MKTNRFIARLLLFCMIINISFPVQAASQKDVSTIINDTAAYLLKTIPEATVGSVGGEWAVIALARSGYEVPQSYYDLYYKNVQKYVSERNGVLHDKKYTEYSRLIIALTAIGKDPGNVSGYNLLTPLGDFEKVIWQGVNGPIFALIALDSGNYEIPDCDDVAIKATREGYISEILSRQQPDGGFSLSGGTSDPDITAMALQALAKYQDRASVAEATTKALDCLSKMQTDSGGFQVGATQTAESAVQVLTALCELGIAVDDSRFVKNNHTVLDNLLTFYTQGSGFVHAIDGSGEAGMSTEQALYALASWQRVSNGQSSLYRMSELQLLTEPLIEPENRTSAGLEGRHADIEPIPILTTSITFLDIAGHMHEKAIASLVQRGIINGITPTEFKPDQSITRAAFTAIIVQSLGLRPMHTSQFADVKESDWYAGYVGTAYSYDIINGKSADTFAPNDTITKQEAAVMITNVSKLCGLDVNLTDDAIRDILAQFADYTTAAPWAVNSLAFCYQNNILPQEDMNIAPTKIITRAQIAEMVYRMLLISELL